MNRCQRLFTADEYDSAVLAAFTTVEEAVRERIGASADELGVTLISNALNPKSPRLRFSDIPAEQEGYHALFRGAIGAIKNPLSHRSVGLTDRMRAFELLAFASSLMRMIDDVPK